MGGGAGGNTDPKLFTLVSTLPSSALNCASISKLVYPYYMIFFIDPNCTAGIRQDMKCHFVSEDSSFDYEDAMSQCIDTGLHPKNLNESDLKNFPWNLFENLTTMVWVGIEELPNRRSRRSNGKIFC